MVEIVGTFQYNKWWPGNSTYLTFLVGNQEIPVRHVEFEPYLLKSNHLATTNKQTLAIRFDNCIMDFIPTGVTKVFNNLQLMMISHAQITKLTKEDFAEYSNLTQLWIQHCNIEYLPGNLLDHLPNLEILAIQSCRLKYIDPEIFENHPNMKVVKFNNNLNIDEYYDSISGDIDGISFDEMKETLAYGLTTPPSDFDTIYHLPKLLSAGIKSILTDDDFKDLTIDIDGEIFHAHSFILAGRSPILREMIKRGKNFSLNGIKKEIFSEILKFFYTDQLPNPNKVNAVDLIKTSEFLKIPHLKQYGMEILENVGVKFTPENVFEMLCYGKETGNDKLQEKAFVAIQKMIPGKFLDYDFWIQDLEKIGKILKGKKKMEDEIREAKERFQALFD